MAEQATRIGARLSKLVTVDVRTDGLRLDSRRWAPFWAALVHAIRNAVDHGIETPEERVGLAKAARGRLSLRARRHGDRVVVEVHDDGRGLDWNGIRLHAMARGLPVASEDDLVAAIFADGFSRREVSPSSRAAASAWVRSRRRHSAVASRCEACEAAARRCVSSFRRAQPGAAEPPTRAA